MITKRDILRSAAGATVAMLANTPSVVQSEDKLSEEEAARSASKPWSTGSPSWI
jgi:hypothetical protein